MPPTENNPNADTVLLTAFSLYYHQAAQSCQFSPFITYISIPARSIFPAGGILLFFDPVSILKNGSIRYKSIL
jgi:hypothetical protein